MARRMIFSHESGWSRNPVQLVFRVAFACSVLLNIYLLFFRGSKPAEEVPPPAEAVTVQGVTITDGTGPADGAASSPAPETAATESPSSEAGSSVAASAGTVVDPETGLRLLTLDVHGSLAQTFNEALGREYGDLVSAFFARIFVWKLDLRSDIRKGDKIEVLYRILPGPNQVDIQAARYHSQKMAQVYSAYWFKAPGRQFGSYFDETGTEIPLTLVDGPIAGYEQITALLRDRTRHQGMDFKAPVGTKVISPFRGRVTRVNWNAPNGTCVEVEFADSKMLAKFLHLSKIMPGVAPGKTVAAGEVIAESGNTGHSTAPHLHYQLEKPAGKIVDPLDFHKTTNAVLGADAKPGFEQTRQRLEKLLTART